MRTALLLAATFFFLTLIPSFSQAPKYKLRNTVEGELYFDLLDLSMDKEGSIYVVDSTEIIKIRSGKAIKRIPYDPYLFGSKTGRPADIVIDHNFNFYLSSTSTSQVLKLDLNGTLTKTINIVGTDGEKIMPSQIILDSKSNFYVFNKFKRQLLGFDSEGNFIKSVALPDVEPTYETTGLVAAFDKNDNIYIAENKRIPYAGTTMTNLPILFKLDNDGLLITRFSTEVIKEAGNITDPMNIKFDSKGDIYVSDVSSAVRVFSPDGSFVRRLVTYIPDPLLNKNNYRIEIDNEDNIYLGSINSLGSSVEVYNANFERIEWWGNKRRPQEIVFDSQENLHILDMYTNKIIKIDPDGKELLVYGGSVTGITKPLAMAIDNQDYIYVLNPSRYDSYVLKFDPSGNLVEKINGIKCDIPTEGFAYITMAGLAVDHLGNIYVSTWGNNHLKLPLAKYDAKGQFITAIGSVGKEKGQFWYAMDVTVDGAGFVYVNDMNGRRIQKFTPDGQFVQQFGSFNTEEKLMSMRSRMSSDAFGNILLSVGINSYGYGYDFDYINYYYDFSGNLIQTLPDHRFPVVAMSRSGRIVANGHLRYDIINFYDNSAPANYNIIKGNVYHDRDVNCKKAGADENLNGILVKATPGPYYGITDTSGNYSILVEKGSYKVEPIIDSKLGNQLNKICYTGRNEQEITFTNYGNISADNDFAADITLSPYLTTSVSSTRRRRCFESTTKVTYANTGFAPAHNAKVYLQLPKEVELLTADKLYTRLPNGTYVFTVGTVAPGQTSVITIQDIVVCGDESIRGLTVCTKAWISTKDIPKLPVVSAKCDEATGNVRFVIKNTTEADMDSRNVFKVYIDGLLASVEEYKLAAGDSLVLWIPGNGKTLRLETNLDGTPASATIEGCSIAGTIVPMSTGLVNILPNNNTAPDVAEECLPIIDSFDPNDKLVTPTGLTNQNYTPTGAELKYKIRFQNTGTDVAYRVVVVDTLSDYLDLSTLQIGSASHNYRFDVSGKGKPVLTWTFDNIMLPDSNSNEPGSHGFIQFSIKPKAELPEKIAVENFADIFFDYNSPVRTNTTINRIYDMPPVVDEAVRLNRDEIVATPVLNAFEPAAGKAGTEIVLSGKKFAITAAQNKVYFNGVAATIVSASSTELKVLVPANATSGKLKIQTTDGVAQSTDGFEIYQAPVVTGFAPIEGVAGATIIVQGEHLTEDWLQKIKLGDQECEIMSIIGNQVTIKVPENALTGNIEAISKGGQALSSNVFMVWQQPVIHSLSKLREKAGATIDITGNNFAPALARNTAWFNNVAAKVVEASETKLKVIVPAVENTGLVHVVTPGGVASSPDFFALIPAPQLTDFTPATGTVGTEIVLTGKHFLALGEHDVITINGDKVLVLEATPTQAKVRVPRGATSGKILVEGPGGTAISSSDFKIETLTPEQAIEVYPNPNTGNFTIRMVHADFDVKQVQLFSALGTSVFAEKIATPRPDVLEVKLPHLKGGIYILHIQTERGLVIKKLHIL